MQGCWNRVAIITAPIQTIKFSVLIDEARRVGLTHAADDAEEQLHRMESILQAVRGLVNYQERAGALGFQLEKADDFINMMKG